MVKNKSFSRRGFVGSLLALFPVSLLAGLFFGGKSEGQKGSLRHIKKLCSMASKGRFGSVKTLSVEGSEVFIEGTVGFGRADFHSLTASAPQISKFVFDGGSTPLFEKVCGKIANKIA